MKIFVQIDDKGKEIEKFYVKDGGKNIQRMECYHYLTPMDISIK